MRGKPVICNETRKVYSSISAAEKALDLKSGSISTAIKSNTPIGDYTFAYYVESEEPPVSEVENSDNTLDKESTLIPDSEVIEEKETSAEEEIPENIIEAEVNFDIDENTLDATAFISRGENSTVQYRRDLVQRLRFRGYDCEVLNDELLFFNIDNEEKVKKLHSLLLRENYKGSYHIFPYDSERYVDILNR